MSRRSVYVTYASEASPGRANEDYAIAGRDWALVVDGATPRSGVRGGCSHGVVWLVRHLAGALAAGLAVEAGCALPDLVAGAIEETRAAHGPACDLTDRDSPSATVAILRRHGNSLEWLLLGDSPLVLDTGGGIRAVVDDRTAHLSSHTAEAVRAARNSPGGFWVASTLPEAAYEAVTGSVEAASVSRAALFSDGAARLVERFGLMDWAGLLDLLDGYGPEEVIRRTRAAEDREPERERAGRRGKRHDDATAVFMDFRRR